MKETQSRNTVARDRIEGRYARSSCTTQPKTSVRRKSRSWKAATFESHGLVSAGRPEGSESAVRVGLPGQSHGTDLLDVIADRLAIVPGLTTSRRVLVTQTQVLPNDGLQGLIAFDGRHERHLLRGCGPLVIYHPFGSGQDNPCRNAYSHSEQPNGQRSVRMEEL